MSLRGRTHAAAWAALLILAVGHRSVAVYDAAPPLPATEFARIVREFSEEDGFFRSENLISNETAYLHIVGKLRKLAGTGGAYIGVGPEQNFTYIAKIRPQIAFIVDIRRQAVVQHLMYKAIFHLADTRPRFLSLLFCKSLDGPDAPGRDASAEELGRYFGVTAPDPESFRPNLARILRAIEEDFKIPLSEKDAAYLSRIYALFRDENLNIRYRSGMPGWPGGHSGAFPTFRALLLEPDLQSTVGNFLAGDADFDFVRSLHERNRIIPVVGDFAGDKALPAIADYLRENGYKVAAFYTSNVEQYLFMNGVFGAFAENVRRLPISDRSVFVRAYPNMRELHPARIPGHRLTMLLQFIRVFLRDFDEGIYRDYWTLTTTNYIGPGPP